MSLGMRARHCAIFSISISAAAVGLTSTAFAQQAAQPAELPAVEVVGKKSTPAKKKQVAKKAPAAKAAPPSAPPSAAIPTETDPSDAPGSPGTATGPVENYAATNSASGTKTDTPLRETPASISVIGKEQMRDQGVQNLQEAFRYTPGVLADAFGYDTRTDSINVRGLTATIFTDGLRSSYGFFAPMIEPYALERAEVLRGPASMLYGQSSTGGIVNAISKLPQATPYGEVTAEYGSFDFKQVKADFTGPLTADKRWLYRVTGLARDADTQVDFVENDRLMIQPSITFRPQAATSITLLGNLRKDESGSLQQFAPAAGTLYPNVSGNRIKRDTFLGEPDDFFDTNSQSVSLFVDHKFTPDLKIHHASRYSRIDQEYVSHVPAVLTPYRAFALSALGFTYNRGYATPAENSVIRLLTDQESERRVFNSDTNLTFELETGVVNHKVTAGYDYSRFASSSARIGIALLNLGIFDQPFSVYDPQYGQAGPYTVIDFNTLAFGIDPDPERAADPSEVQYQQGIYVQDQLRLGNWIALLGIRHDWLKIDEQGVRAVYDTATTLRGGLMYEFDFGLTPYVSYSESFVPQPGQRVLAENSLANFLASNPTTRAATAVEGEQVEIGFKFQPRGANWMINGAIYELEESNQVKDPDTLVDSLQGATARIRGFEIEGVGQVTPELKLIAGYSYTDAEYIKYPAPFELKKGTPVENVPKHQASFWGIYSWQTGFLRGLSVGAGVRYIGENTDTSPDLLSVVFGAPEIQSVTVPSYTLFDAMMSYETPTWRWTLTAQNLEDEYIVSACSVLRGDCFLGQSRTIITGLTYKF